MRRDRSPARELFDQPLALPRYDAFYFTGITLAVTQTGLANLVTGLGKLKSDGCRIIFDSNYRPGLWADHALAQEHYRAVLPLCDMVLPSLEDEIALWGHHSIQACRQMYQGFGVRELVIKGHGLTAHAFSDQGEIEQQAQAVDAIDTTGAGDSFNAGYLATRLRNGSIRDSLNAAQQLSAAVVQHRGAILPLLHTATTGTH